MCHNNLNIGDIEDMPEPTNRPSMLPTRRLEFCQECKQYHKKEHKINA